MATINILSRALIPATQLQPERVKIGISGPDASLIQSNPNALSLTYNVWFGVPNYTVNVNGTLYYNSTVPPYNNHWFIIQEGLDWFIYLNTNPITYTSFIGWSSWKEFGFPYSIPVSDPNYVTLLSQPGSFMPVYNPIVFTFSSPKYNEIGYRYLVDIKDPSDNIINRLKVVPRPDGTGYIDIQKILSNYVSVDVDFNMNLDMNNDCVNSYMKYKVSLGEEYLSSWEYTNFVEQIGGLYDGYVVLNQINTSILHTYNVGDQITIDTDTSGLAQNVGGLHSVVLVPNNYQVVIDVIYPNNDPSIAIPGSTRYSDSRKTGYSNLTTIDNLIVYNGVFSWKDWKELIPYEYIIDYLDEHHNLLSSIEQSDESSPIHLRYYIDLDQKYFLNYATLSSTTTHILIMYDMFGNEALYVINNGGGSVRQFTISYDFFINNGMSPDSEISPDSEWVKFYIVDYYTYRRLSGDYAFYFDRRCKINNIHIYFMDKLGSILSIPFQLRENQSISIERESSKVYSDYSSRTSLDLTQGGDTINHITSKKTYSLNTNWMNDRQMELFEIMMESPYTWLSIDGDTQSCIIEDTSLEIEKYKNKSLFKKNIKVRLSNQDPLNI